MNHGIQTKTQGLISIFRIGTHVFNLQRVNFAFSTIVACLHVLLEKFTKSVTTESKKEYPFQSFKLIFCLTPGNFPFFNRQSSVSCLYSLLWLHSKKIEYVFLCALPDNTHALCIVRRFRTLYYIRCFIIDTFFSVFDMYTNK